MKKNYFTSIFICFNFSVAFSQITITSSDMPQAGHHYFTSAAVNTSSIDPLLTGANYQWDFGALSALISMNDTFGSTSLLPLSDQLFFFGSNLVEYYGESLTVGTVTINNIYNVYKNSTGELDLSGYAGTLNGVPIPMVYSPRDAMYHFPLHYGDADSADADLIADVPNVLYISQQRHRVNETDGWGSVTTPLGIFDVLRVKSIIRDIDSVYVSALGFGIKVPSTSYEYKWLTNEKGTPVVQVNAQDVLGVPVVTSITYQDSARSIGISKGPSKEAIAIFPQLASDYFILLNAGNPPMKLKMMDAIGNNVMEINSVDVEQNISVSDLTNGLYYVECISGGGVRIMKIIIQH